MYVGYAGHVDYPTGPLDLVSKIKPSKPFTDFLPFVLYSQLSEWHTPSSKSPKPTTLDSACLSELVSPQVVQFCFLSITQICILSIPIATASL